MTQELAIVELLQAGRYLLPEPCVVIEVMFDELLNVLIRAAMDLDGHSLQLRL